MTTVYLIRHSKTIDYAASDIIPKDLKLDSVGKKMAEEFFSRKEFDNLDNIYSSNYIRSFQTAKYLSEKQNIKIIIDGRFDGRIVGIPNDKEYPDWYFRQFEDRDFKTVGGESINDNYKRFNSAFLEIVRNNKGKRVAIFTHSNPIIFFLINYLDSYKVNGYKNFTFIFKNKKIFEDEIKYLDTFKLEVDDNEKIIDIKVIRYE